MQRLTTMTRVLPAQLLSPSLSLLAAAAVDARTGVTVGQVEGVVVDDSSRIVCFVVRLSRELFATGDRILVPIAAVEVSDADATGMLPARLRMLWTREQVLAQPHFDCEAELPHDRWSGNVPTASSWMPARPNRVPPGSGGNGRLAFANAAQAGALGAGAGALIGLAVGGPAVALGLGTMFMLGAGVAGAIVGASRESAVEAGELGTCEPSTTAGTWQVHRLEDALRSGMGFRTGAVRATSIAMTADRAPAHQKNIPGASSGPFA